MNIYELVVLQKYTVRIASLNRAVLVTYPNKCSIAQVICRCGELCCPNCVATFQDAHATKEFYVQCARSVELYYPLLNLVSRCQVCDNLLS
jgi:hypothetical protein